MRSCALMTGQHQQIRPSSTPLQAAPHHAHNGVRNQQPWTANNCRATNSGVQTAHGDHFPLHNEACSNKQVPIWHTSAGPYQGTSSQQTDGGNTKDYYFSRLLVSSQNRSTDMQSRNPGLPASGFQVPTLQDFHQNSSTQSPPNQMNANATCSQPNTLVHWKQSLPVKKKQTVRMQDGKIVTGTEQVRVQKNMYQNVNRDLTQPISAHTATATSLPPEQALGFNTISASENPICNVQTLNNQSHGQNGTHRGFSHVNPPNYKVAHSQLFRNKNIATYPPSSVQNSYGSCTSQKPQQYPAQHSLTHETGMDATILSNSNSYTQYGTVHHFRNKRELSLNPAITQKQELKHIVGADSLCNFYAAGSNGCPPPHTYTSSLYREQQSVRQSGIMVSNQPRMPPETSATSESINLNTSQFLPYHSGQSPPKSTRSVMSRTQYTVNAPPQKNSTAGNGSGITKANSAFLSNHEHLIALLTNGSQLMQFSEGISTRRNMTRSSIESRYEMLPSVQQNDSSVHSSPAQTGSKAVAVVQPLTSLESGQVPNNHASCNTTTGESLNKPENISKAVAKNREAAYLREESTLSPKSPNDIIPKKSAVSQSTLSSDGTVFSNLDSGIQNSGKRPEPDVNVAQSVQNSVLSKVPVSQNTPDDKSEMQTSPATPVFDLSSVQMTPWTALGLINLIRDAEKAQKKSEYDNELNGVQKILNLFWDGKFKTLHTYARMVDFLKGLAADVKNFCSRHLTPDSVVLLQVNGSFEEQMKSCHVLKDGEVFSELPYKSSWLNVNEQLDEIDKEFGFPLTLTHQFLMIKSKDHKDRVEIINSVPAPTVSEVPNKVLLLSHFEPVFSGEDKEPSFQKANCYSDPCFSLKIEVLPPEEAKRFFEQGQNEMPESMDVDSQEVISSPMESETPVNIEATLSESELESGKDKPTEHLARLVEMVSGSSTPSLFKWHCQKEQSHEECTRKTLDNGETSVLSDNNELEMVSDSNFYPAVEGENPVKGNKITDSKVMTFSDPELWCVLSQTIDLTKDDDQLQSSSNQKLMDISQISNSSNSSIILLSDENEDLFNNENEIPNQMPDFSIVVSEPEYECGQEQFKSTETKNLGSSASTEKAEIEKFTSIDNEVAIWMSDKDESCGQTELKSADVAESLLKTKENSKVGLKVTLKIPFNQFVKHEKTKRKRKRLNCHDQFVPFQKVSKKCISPIDLDLEHALDGASKCEKELAGDTEAQNIASKSGDFELVLFGSAQKDKRALIGGRKTRFSSLKDRSNTAQRPPEVLSVNVGTLSCKSSEAVDSGNYSAKQLIHEKWRRSFQPTKIMFRNKLKELKQRSESKSGTGLKNDKPQVSSEMRDFGNTKRCMSFKMTKSHFKRCRKDTTKDIVTDHSRRSSKNTRQAVIPLQENNVLRFSVLPSTFNFKDGSNGTKESTNPVSEPAPFTEEPDLEIKEQSPNKAVTKPKGKWCPNPEKYRSLRIPKTFGLFHEYQKKYKEKTQSNNE